MKNLANRDQMLVYLAAQGHKNTEIAEQLELDPSTVRSKLADERIQFEIKSLRYKLHGADHKRRFQGMIPHAIDTMEAILHDRTAKPATKLAAAQDLLDRALGKPKQTVEHEGSLIKMLFEKLDEKDGKAVYDVTPESGLAQIPSPRVNPVANPNNEEMGKPEPNPNLDPIDDWASKNL